MHRLVQQTLGLFEICRLGGIMGPGQNQELVCLSKPGSALEVLSASADGRCGIVETV